MNRDLSRNHPHFRRESAPVSPWEHRISSEALESRIVLSAQPIQDLLHSLMPEPSWENFGTWESIPAGQAPSFHAPMAHPPEVMIPELHALSPISSSKANPATPVSVGSSVHQQYGLRGEGQTIAVIDSGIAWDHAALGRGFGADYRVVGGWDFAENDPLPYDDAPAGFHGTHVAGIIGADGKQQGVAPEVDLVALRVFNDAGRGQLAWTEQALQWVHKNRNAFANPITTVNLSLGSSWNSDVVPNWGSLEDELQQLYKEGIVVVAAAGNSFQQFKMPGLSYPAVSPYVIPVASVDNDGMISDFSQRNDRVIAAPGRSILSTVPDHLLGRDGKIDDWSVSSGTSMAAPYVAGASALVREAMTLAGWTNINTQSIYQVFQETADSVWDSMTNRFYDRLNLQKAIDSILPDDLIGDTWQQGKVEVLSDGQVSREWLNSLQDRDVFRFTADRDGIARFQAASHSIDTFSWSQWDGSLESQLGSRDQIEFAVKAGGTYAIGLSGSSVGAYAIDWDFEPTAKPSPTPPLPPNQTIVDLGVVDAIERTLDSNSRFSAKASHDGLFSMVLQGDASSVGSMIARVGQGAWQTDSQWENGQLRIDLEVRAGDSIDWQVPLHGGKGWTIHALNLVEREGNQITIHGGRGNEDVAIDLSKGMRIKVENIDYTFDPKSIDTITIDAEQGNDSLSLIGSARAEKIEMRTDGIVLEGQGVRIHARNMEQAEFSGGGGIDRAYLYDAPTDDTLDIRPQMATLSGTGYRFQVSDVDRIYVHANQGGEDHAYLHDSQGNDILSIRPQFSSLRGDGFFNYVNGFERVYAYADRGGNDLAQLYDSVGDDRFQTSGDAASIVGSNFFSYTRYFERVEAYATAGGHDIASLYANKNASLGVGTDFASYESSGLTRLARGFERIQTFVDGMRVPSSSTMAFEEAGHEANELFSPTEFTPRVQDGFQEPLAGEWMGSLPTLPGIDSTERWSTPLASVIPSIEYAAHSVIDEVDWEFERQETGNEDSVNGDSWEEWSIYAELLSLQGSLHQGLRSVDLDLISNPGLEERLRHCAMSEFSRDSSMD